MSRALWLEAISHPESNGAGTQRGLVGGILPKTLCFWSLQLSPCLSCLSSQRSWPGTLPLLSPKIWPAIKRWLLFLGCGIQVWHESSRCLSLSPSNGVLWDYLWQALCAPGEWGLGLSPRLSLQGLEQK